MIKRILHDRRSMAIAVSVIAVVAIVATGLLIVVRPGFTAQATATISPSASPLPSDSPTPLPSPSPTLEGSPTPIPADWAYSDLDGLPAPKDSAHRLPMAIMIDDNIVARPQSGISSASIVYQAPADGGEDRYMLVFQEGTASDIGPVRSARPYFVYWAAEYKAVFGHYGGDAETLGQVIPNMFGHIYDMDALRGQPCPYHRITTRDSPHNAYTDSTVLISCATKYKYPATYQGLPARTFVDDTPASERPVSRTIAIPYRTGSVGYDYDAVKDSYLRSVDGHPQTDPANGQQVYARNVIVLFQALTYDSKVDPGHSRPVLTTIGSGQAIVFKEGQAIVGTWKKTSATALTRLYDGSGKEIPLVRGEIFIQAVPIGTKVTYNS